MATAVILSTMRLHAFPPSVTFGIKVGKSCRALKPRRGALCRFTFTPMVHLNLQAAVLNRHQQRSPELPRIQASSSPHLGTINSM